MKLPGKFCYVTMHTNVRAAAEMQDIVTYDQAEEAYRIINSLVKLSYKSSPSRVKVHDLSPGDLALDFCEYACILKELRRRRKYNDTDTAACRWLQQPV